MALTLYSNYLNSAGERVRIALALKGIDYDYVSVGEIGWDAYETINPQRLMPALKIGDQIVPQATAILEYLEETFPEPPLLPTDPVRRAQARGFAQHVVSEMHAIDVIRVRRFLHHELGVAQAGIEHWQRHWFATGFAALEALLARRPTAWPYCFGKTPGWADLHLIPQVAKGLSRFNVDMAPYPLIHDVYKACVDLPAFIAATPRQQPDYPGEVIEPDLQGRSGNNAI
ncbi:MAG: maleylacetoacetate isomerase [Rhodospirillaceae bacterium]|jgi:maleylacetoacetate isomerase|nr:maleylacetoacetate isomerase [Rhodospirillaceae bacterium]MBT3495554.1 maleylacetoacetate isomerase [Rhodospirillaceae bacterium]MBT3779395.1 maleylacetoacetate isomerase [Rhodospirillaceae bacterium]MBT4168994.1 maleylacetoacetate isomerase [Rhodospirillaceae bacterium]MBT4561415.1 maleylacetoacetate isomerase [Rhodospirillaceae bacterium]